MLTRLVALALLALSLAANAQPAPAHPAESWTLEGTVFTSETAFGGWRGALGETTLLRLRDGRYRMYIGAVPAASTIPAGIHSAISIDGIHFTMEPGPRVNSPVVSSQGTPIHIGTPHVLRLPDGRVRLFVHGGESPAPQPVTGGIYSLTSTDEGMTFTLDPGIRISNAALGVRQVVGPSLVPVPSGGWRMYFSERNPPVVDPVTGARTFAANRVFSAHSGDLETWTVDPGVRAGPGSAIVNSGSAQLPAAIANDDGSVTLVYERQADRMLMAATAPDGLAFTEEVPLPIADGSALPFGTSPFLMRGESGVARLYYSTDDAESGTIYVARHPPLTAVGAGRTDNHTGLWWAAPAGRESGWGINFTHQGDIVFATLFTYDAQGKPMWLVMSNGAKQADGATFRGTLYRTRGPAFDARPFVPIGAGNFTAVGTLSVRFTSAATATLEYSVDGTTVRKLIQRQVYGSRAASCAPASTARRRLANYQDLWWNPDESGWGLNVTHQDETLFATLFTYDATGKAVWWVMSNGARLDDGAYAGSLYRTEGAPFDAERPEPTKPEQIIPVGFMKLTFTDGENGELVYSVADNVNITKAITRQVFASPVQACAS